MRIKHFVRDQIFTKNYFLAKAGYLGWYHVKSIGKNPLLIYQMGKVASRSVEASLRAILVDRPIFHLHCLSEPAIARAEVFYYEGAHSFNRRLKSDLPDDLFASYFIRNQVIGRDYAPEKKWKVITLVRDPVARNISGFFQNISFRIPDFYRRLNSITFEELFEAFLATEEHETHLTWFDLELKPFFGIDVYSTPFPQNKGYKIYTSAKADLLLLRVEDLSRIFSHAISEFLDIDGVKLTSINTAKEKQYYDTYRTFVDSLALPASYLEKMYNSKYARTFYSEEEIRQFISRWQP